MMGPALIDEDDLAVRIQPLLDHRCHLERPGAAGPARQVHQGIGLGCGRDGGCAHHEDADLPPVGFSPIFGNGQVATLDTGWEVEVGDACDVRLGTGRARVDSVGWLGG